MFPYAVTAAVSTVFCDPVKEMDCLQLITAVMQFGTVGLAISCTSLTLEWTKTK